MSEAPATFKCPSCGTPVEAGATRCLVCAERGQAKAQGAATPGAPATPVANEPPGTNPVKVVLLLGCVVLLIVCAAGAITVRFVLRSVQKLQKDEIRRQQNEVIDEDKRRYEAQQNAQRRLGAGRPPGAPASELAGLGTPLKDLAGNTTTAAAGVEHGGVIVVFHQGCADCKARMKSVERVVAAAKKMNLGAELVIMNGTPEGPAQDGIPDSLRPYILLDPQGAFGKALDVRDLSAIVVDSNGQDQVYKGTCDDAIGMLQSVERGE